MRRIYISLLFLFSLSAPASAEVAVMGLGTVDCSKYLESVKRHGDDMREMYFQWALGFMSGVNAKLLNGGQTTDLGMFKADRQIVALEKYCEDHPDNPYYSGVAVLIDVIREEQNLADWRGQQSERKGLGR